MEEGVVVGVIVGLIEVVDVVAVSGFVVWTKTIMYDLALHIFVTVMFYFPIFLLRS